MVRVGDATGHLGFAVISWDSPLERTSGTSGFRIQTGRFGPLRFRTGLPSLSEIAADRFASVVLGLRVPPKALGLVTIYAMDSDYAWRVFLRPQEVPA